MRRLVLLIAVLAVAARSGSTSTVKIRRDATGQAVNNFGAAWFVVGTDGNKIR
jgi:hypothetical protein